MSRKRKTQTLLAWLGAAVPLLVVAIKGLPGDTRVDLGWGVFAFAGSVVRSMAASVLIKRLEKPAAAAAQA